MTPDEAVAVLNRVKHDGCGGWYFDYHFVRGRDQYQTFSAFEATAIAEKYLREANTSIAPEAT